ncbi:hypothetical protein IPH70_05475 [Candidatus Roizmanbacteria bacterium]|nr:MAG: hypothetical protein IPH70_05475 [Candidatus Roizmanbacteria bacterium]
MKDMGERLSPVPAGGIPQKFEARVMEPLTKPGSGRGSDTVIPGSGTSFTPDGQPNKPRKSHKARNLIIAGTAAIGGVGGCTVIDQFGNQPSQGETPVVTTVAVQTTDLGAPVTTSIEPQTTLPPSTTLESTTTAEPTPTDVVESKDGYDVLRNGGLLYEVESAPQFGGFELHMKDGSHKYGFKKVEEGVEAPQEALFEDLLWTFGAQHPEFIRPEGGVDVEAYKAYLSEHDWVDTVYLPDNISEPIEHVKYPPVIKSVPLTMDFKKPMIISSGDLTKIDGFDPFAGFYEYYYPTSADNARMLMGMTPDGQFFFSYHTLTTTDYDLPLSQGSLRPLSYELGEIMSITAALNYPLDPQLQWIAPSLTYWVPGSKKIDSSTVPSYEDLSKIVLSFFDFAPANSSDNALFTKVS